MGNESTLTAINQLVDNTPLATLLRVSLISFAFNSQLCICETKPRTMPLVQTNEKIANAIFNHGHNMSLAKCSVAKIIEAQYKGLFL